MRRAIAAAACGIAASVGIAMPAHAEPNVTRLAGSDRYETAVAISKYGFQPEYEGKRFNVTVASGANFPDALAAGALADSREGPLLLVPRDGALPSAVTSELKRLNPYSIYIAGGVSSVSSVIEGQLDDYSTGYRLYGQDRYETSAEVASWTFQADTTVFLATGVSFPDALGGAAAAGRLNGALMLARPTALPEAVADELRWNQPGKVVVLGGTTAISDGVISQVRAVVPRAEVVRWYGNSRYETAARISQETYPQGANTVWLASGLNYADALAGGPVAAKVGAPMLLTRPDCVPPATLQEIQRLGARNVVVLGGEAAVSDAAANLTSC